MSQRLIAYVLDKLRDERSFTSVAKDFNLSVSTVIRIFDYLSYPKATLSSALSIDEFKGNTGREKYQCILTDPVKHVVLDILPKRYDYYLTNYVKSYPGEEREKVRYFVVICGDHMHRQPLHGFPMPHRLLINITGFAR